MQEFSDFLASQPPFDALNREELQALSRTIKVAFYPAGTVISSGQDDITELWVIRTGQVEVFDQEHILDVLTAGDSFGRAASPLQPGALFRASRDTVCYQLPDPATVLPDAQRLRFAPLVPHASRPRVRDSALLSAGQHLVGQHMRPVLWAEPGESIASAARRIGEAETSCVLLRTDDAVSIATDRDFRSRVATGQVGVDAPMSAIAVGPVESINKNATVASALLRMVEAGVHHLAVTDDTGAPIGVVRAIDLGSVDVRDPLIMRAAIDSAHDLDALAQAAAMLRPTLMELDANDVPALRIAQLQTAIVESIVRRVIALDTSAVELDDVTWMVLGSLARREPLPTSDVDTALLWDNPVPETQARARRDVATKVLTHLARCGLERCPDGANADNPLFSKSRQEGTASATRWVADPSIDGALLLSSIIADSRSLSDPLPERDISGPLTVTAKSPEFRQLLLQFATSVYPPTGFVRDFVVERGGEHRGLLNLKRGGLRPIVSLARWLGIVLGDVQGSTVERVRRAAAAGLLTTGEADSLAHAFTDIFELVHHNEIDALRAGRDATTWIQPERLDSLTRRQLRESFRAVATIQTSVTNNWRTRLSS